MEPVFYLLYKILVRFVREVELRVLGCILNEWTKQVITWDSAVFGVIVFHG